VNVAYTDEPRFSVVTVALNCADDAERTARSVLAQSYPYVEYLVKDGGSTDGTPERLRELGVRQIVTTPDTGIYDAMNQALTLCSGQYVCFMNAGDSFAGPDTLASVAARLEQLGEPEFAYGDIRSLVRHPYIRPEDQRDGRLIRYPERLGRFWLYRKMICHQAWFVRRELYGDAPFDQNYRILADYVYLLEMGLRRRVRYAHLPEVVAIFDADGLSTRHNPQLRAERRRAQRAFFPPWEALLYRSLFEGASWLNRRLVYRWIYPLLPDALRGRVSGM
jgi:glycosyltransferase involved in cell wall biosynthesis